MYTARVTKEHTQWAEQWLNDNKYAGKKMLSRIDKNGRKHL